MSRDRSRIQSRHAVGTWKGREAEFCNDRLVVSVREGQAIESTIDSIANAVARRVGATPAVELIGGTRWAVLRFPPLQDAGARILQLAAEISEDKRVRYAEPSFIGHGSYEPTGEAEWDNQKDWVRAIDLPGAWDHTFGDSGVLLAIIDSGTSIAGTDPDHPDIQGGRYIVRNGTVKQDYVDDDDCPQDTHEAGHGTHVTGIASAPGDNTNGIAGVNWVSDVYVAKVLDANDDFETDRLLKAVTELLAYATAAGKKMVVVNISLHLTPDAVQLTELLDMCEAAKGFGGKILLCCAAEVYGLSRSELQYPAAYASSYDFICVVGGTTGTDDAADDSIADPLGLDTYDAVDIFAPSVDIYATLPTYKRSHGTDMADEMNYGSRSGSSMATPMVAGVASLMWGVNNDLSAKGIIASMRAVADQFKYPKITRDSATGAILSEVETVHYRLNASEAVLAALWNIELTDNHIEFTDAAVGIPDDEDLVFDVECAHELTFEVFENKLPAALTVTASGTYTSGSEFRGIKVTYTPPAAGDISYGDFRVRCNETQQEWHVFVTASAVASENIAAVLVADRSGSMAELSGIGTMTRMDVLQEAAGILVDKMRVGDGLAVVGFSSTVDEPSPYGTFTATTNRQAIKDDIATMSPGGGTSIGGGVEKGVDALSGATQPRKAMLVLTDGQENTPPFVADVMASVDMPVYAIGMGTADVLQPEPLEVLAAETNGCLVLTDTLDEERRYVVAKYIVQMLAGMTGDDVVLDPAGRLRPRQVVTIPFNLCEDDRECEVTLLVSDPRLVRMQVKTPKDVEVTAGALKVGTRMMSRRFALPVEEHHAGPWTATLELAGEESEEKVRRYAESIKMRVPSLRYALLVTTKSAIRMNCSVFKTSSAPGATVTVRATVTRRGQPYHGHVRVHAVVHTRNQGTAKLDLERTNDGSFQGSFVAAHSGVYECVVRASGIAPRGQRFHREQTLTAHCWRPVQQPVDLDRARMRERDRGQS